MFFGGLYNFIFYVRVDHGQVIGFIKVIIIKIMKIYYFYYISFLISQTVNNQDK